MAEKVYFWLKLPVNFFKDRPMKKLKRIAGGPTYLIIYQKLLLLSLENEGNIYFENIEETFEEEMSLEIDENSEDIQMTLVFLYKNNLIEKIDHNTYFMTQVPEMIGKETDSARRKRKSRLRQSVTMSQNNVTNSQLIKTKSQHVTKCPTELETELETELDLEQQQEKNTEKSKDVVVNEQTSNIVKLQSDNNAIAKDENVVADTKFLSELVLKFKNKYKGDLDFEILKDLYIEKGREQLEFYYENLGIFLESSTNDIRNICGFYIYLLKKSIALPKKIKTNNIINNKPIQSTNYEQRPYEEAIGDDFVYDNDCFKVRKDE